MLIGIIADTHDNAVNLLKAVEVFNQKGVGLVIHCGDWVSPFMPDFCGGLKCKIISVWGNNEGDVYRFLTRHQKKNWNIEFHKKSVELELDGRKLAVYHGDSKPCYRGLLSAKNMTLFSQDTPTPLWLRSRARRCTLTPAQQVAFANQELLTK